jgi:hypothetical protein
MTHNELNQLCHTATALPPEQMRQLRDELDRKLSALAAAASPAAGGDPDADPLLGLWRDYADEMDKIVEDAMRHRQCSQQRC